MTNVMEWLPADKQGNWLPRIEVQFWEHGRSYSYAWAGGPIKVGDWVRTPRPDGWLGFHRGFGKVTRVGSTYEGPVITLGEKIR